MSSVAWRMAVRRASPRRASIVGPLLQHLRIRRGSAFKPLQVGQGLSLTMQGHVPGGGAPLVDCLGEEMKLLL
jgi:hypothetical protein